MKNQILILIMFLLTLSLSQQTYAQINVDSTFNAGVTEGKVQVYTTAVQPDGKIIAGGGFSLANGVEKNVLARLNADGSIDSTFNSGGAGPNSIVYEIIILSDGKILIAGGFTTYNGVAKSGIVRLNADGTLDTTFNSAGTGFNGIPHTLSLQSDEKILASGQFNSYNGTTKFSVIRINTDGTLDTTFNSPFTTNQYVEEVDVQTDGKILVAGNFTIGSPARADVARLNADGSLDTTFNATGGGTDGGGVYGMTLQSDGKILIGGGFKTYNGTARTFIARLNTDGTLDTAFVPPTYTGNGVEYFAIQPDGKILAAGGLNNTLPLPALVRLNPDGSNDSTFQGNTADALGYHVKLQPDGKILLGGFFNYVNGQLHSNLARLNSDGSLDNAFNSSFTGFGYAAAIAIQTDGKTIAAGNFNFADGSARNNVARFNTDGTLDTNFTVGSGTFLDSVNYSNIVNAIAIQSDGKILVGGVLGGYNGVKRRTIFRLNTDGTLDTSFEAVQLTSYATSLINDILVLPSGKILIAGSFLGTTNRNLLLLNSDGTTDTSFASPPNGAVVKMLLQSDGKIVIGGNFTTVAGQSRNRIARLNSDGTIDTSFDPGTGANSTVNYFALQFDGRIIAVGNFSTFNGTNHAGIVRLNANGSVDSSFGGAGTNSTVESVIIQSDSKLFIAGRFTSYNGVVRNRLARINSDGSLDTSFVSGFDNDPRFFARRVSFQPDGKLIVGGLFKTYAGATHNALVRINPNANINVPVSNGRIVFVSHIDENDEIYTMNPDGSNITRLTNNTENDYDPQWSPDGTKIVFSSARDGNYEIYVMNADGTNQTRITNNSAVDDEPTWSPDGTKIAFSSARDGNFEIYAMNANGTNQTRLTNTAADELEPRWSPTGAQIAFVSNRDGNYEIYAMNANGDAQTRLTNNSATDSFPDWSPDSSQLLFSSDRDGNQEIYVMSSNGTNQTRITNNSSIDNSPVWSPDGLKILFRTERDGNYEVYKMNADGSNPIRLTNNPDSDGPADWQSLFAPRKTLFDFDGDGKADLSVFRPTDTIWYILGSSAGFGARQWGVASDKLVPADYDGDGKTDYAVWRPLEGNFYIINSSNNSVRIENFGLNGDIPTVGDWDGDGKADLSVYRDSAIGNQSFFFYRGSLNNPSGNITYVPWGIANDQPVIGDFDGDGKQDPAIYRPSEQVWYVRQSSNSQLVPYFFGLPTDKRVPADYDGDGKTDIAVFRDGIWYIRQSSDNQIRYVYFGIASDVLAPADYDGDGKTDVAVFRNGTWYVSQSIAGLLITQFGVTDDKPIANSYVR